MSSKVQTRHPSKEANLSCPLSVNPRPSTSEKRKTVPFRYDMVGSQSSTCLSSIAFCFHHLHNGLIQSIDAIHSQMATRKVLGWSPDQPHSDILLRKSRKAITLTYHCEPLVVERSFPRMSLGHDNCRFLCLISGFEVEWVQTRATTKSSSAASRMIFPQFVWYTESGQPSGHILTRRK